MRVLLKGSDRIMNSSLILSVQDISCFGQCSLTVALPILSSFGVETAILPTAILSTHTGGFKGFTFRNLESDVAPIRQHWEKEGIRFDAIYTGYLGSSKDVEEVLAINASLNKGLLIVDPAFADHGKLYGGFDLDYVEAMKGLCSKADILLPNLTEAAFLLGVPWNPNPTEDEVNAILDGLFALGAKSVVLKGIGSSDTLTGFVYADKKNRRSYEHTRLPKDYHGTGDVFASVFVGCLQNGVEPFECAKHAADFVSMAIANTIGDEKHVYGVKFEPLLSSFVESIKK